MRYGVFNITTNNDCNTNSIINIIQPGFKYLNSSELLNIIIDNSLSDVYTSYVSLHALNQKLIATSSTYELTKDPIYNTFLIPIEINYNVNNNSIIETNTSNELTPAAIFYRNELYNGNNASIKYGIFNSVSNVLVFKHTVNGKEVNNSIYELR